MHLVYTGALSTVWSRMLHHGHAEAAQAQAVGHHDTLENAIAAPASIGFSSPAAASGIAATL